MEKSDLNNFGNLWQFYRRKFNAQPLDNVVLLDIFDDLKEFSLMQIHDALKIYSRQGRFAPVVADVIEIAEKQQGLSLEHKAKQWLDRLNSHLNRAYDYVSLDWRAVNAFKAVYAGLNHYCDWDSFYEAQARKAFIEEYKVAIKHNITEDDHLIKGLYHSKNPTVRLLETLADSKDILRQLYDPRQVTLSYQSFDPAKPKLISLNQSEPKVNISSEERLENIEKLSKLLKQMSSDFNPDFQEVI